MKKLFALLLLAAAGYLAWLQFQPPGALEGRVVDPSTKVRYAPENPSRLDITDFLEQDVWTLMYFGSGTQGDQLALQRELETAVRTRHQAVRMVIVHLPNVQAPVGVQHGLKELPTLWLFDGYGKRSGRRSSVERLILGTE